MLGFQGFFLGFLALAIGLEVLDLPGRIARCLPMKLYVIQLNPGVGPKRGKSKSVENEAKGGKVPEVKPFKIKPQRAKTSWIKFYEENS